MDPMMWLMRASRWARHPPSAGRVVLVLAVIALAVLIVALDRTGAWPDWARMERMRRPALP